MLKVFLSMIFVLGAIGVTGYADQGRGGGSGSDNGTDSFDQEVIDNHLKFTQISAYNHLTKPALDVLASKAPDVANIFFDFVSKKYIVRASRAELDKMLADYEKTKSKDIIVVTYMCNQRVVSGRYASVGEGAYIGLGIGASSNVSSGYQTACDGSTTTTETRTLDNSMKHSAAGTILAIQSSSIIWILDTFLTQKVNASAEQNQRHEANVDKILRHELIVGYWLTYNVDSTKKDSTVDADAKDKMLAANIFLEELLKSPGNYSSAEVIQRLAYYKIAPAKNRTYETYQLQKNIIMRLEASVLTTKVEVASAKEIINGSMLRGKTIETADLHNVMVASPIYGTNGDHYYTYVKGDFCSLARDKRLELVGYSISRKMFWVKLIGWQNYQSTCIQDGDLYLSAEDIAGDLIQRLSPSQMEEFFSPTTKGLLERAWDFIF